MIDSESIFDVPGEPLQANVDYNTGNNKHWVNGLLVATQRISDDSSDNLGIIVDGEVRSGSCGDKSTLSDKGTTITQPLPPSVTYSMRFSPHFNPANDRIQDASFIRVGSTQNLDFIGWYEGLFHLKLKTNETTKIIKKFDDNVLLTVNLQNGSGQGFHQVDVAELVKNEEKIFASVSATYYASGMSSMCIPLKKDTEYVFMCTAASVACEVAPNLYFSRWLGSIYDSEKYERGFVAKTDGFLVVRAIANTRFDMNSNTEARISKPAGRGSAADKVVLTGFCSVSYAKKINNRRQREQLARTILLPVSKGYDCNLYTQSQSTGNEFPTVEGWFIPVELN